MAIAFDASSRINTGSSHTALSWSHTCSGSDRYLVVATGTNGGGSDATGVTYAGVPMTQLGTQQEGPTGYRCTLWGLAAPASGTNSITVAWLESHSTECMGASFTGVHQTLPTGTNSTHQTAAASLVNSLSASTTFMVVDAIAWNQFASPATESVGPQQQRVGAAFASGAFTKCMMSYETGSSTTTMSWGFDFATNAAEVAIPLLPVGAGGSTGSANVPPAFSTYTYQEYTTAGTAITVNTPGTYNAGDLFMAIISWATATETIYAIPAGWTNMRNSFWGSANDISMSTYYHIASAAEAASYTWNMTGTGVQRNGAIVRVTGAHATTPFDGVNGQGGYGTGVSSNAVTTLYNNEIVFFPVACRSSQTGKTLTPPPGYTSIFSLLNSGVCSTFLAYTTQAGAGSTGNPSGVVNNLTSSNPWVAEVVTFRPPDASIDTRQLGMEALPLPPHFTDRNRWPTVYCGWLGRETSPFIPLPVPPTAFYDLPQIYYLKGRADSKRRFQARDFVQGPLAAPAPGSPPPPGPPPPSPPPPIPPAPGSGSNSTNTILPRISLPPQQSTDEAQWRRQAAAWMAEANKGHLQNTGVITLAANQNTTTVIDDRAGPTSMIEFMPRNAEAAAELGNGTMFVASQDNGSFIITHSNNSSTSRTFVYSILG